jgi:glycosyltransferase involved in cell wall biosynthesis
MRKLVVVQILRAPVGGIRKHVIDIVESLGNLNIDQIFFTNLQEADKDLSYLNQVANLKIYNLNISEKPGISDIFNVFSIFRKLRNTKVDVIHGHGAKGGLYARILGLFLSGRIFYTPHGGSLHRVFGKVKSFVYDLIERLLVPLTSKFIFESEYSSREFLVHIKDVSEKMIVNYNGIDLPDIYKSTVYQPQSVINFASFGLLRQLKGHDIFIRALSKIKKSGIPFVYVIYGSGEYLETLESLISDLNLSDNIFIRPFTSNIFSEMINYDFVVHPSRFESFGYVPVEAMAVGVPVISSISGGLNEVVNTDVALIAPSNDVEEYVNIIEGCYNGRRNISALRDNARIWISEKFTRSGMINNLLSIYYNG